MRIDKYLALKNNFSRTKAQELIKTGAVFVNGKVVDKVSFEIEESAMVDIKECKQYVSRGAYKLLGATEKFNFDFVNKTVLDIGASTGGFTQVAIENGAKKVYAVDIGENELAEKLIGDKRVVNIHSTDFRNLQKAQVDDVNLIIGDISFISLKHIFPKIIQLFGNKIEVCILFKPQFECGVEKAKKYKGVVLDKKLHKELLNDFCLYLQSFGFNVSGVTFSDICGKQGNIEYLFHLNGNFKNHYNIENIVDNAFCVLKK